MLFQEFLTPRTVPFANKEAVRGIECAVHCLLAAAQQRIVKPAALSAAPIASKAGRF